MARTYKRDSNGRFASTGGARSGRPAAKPVSRGRNRITRDNAGKITSVGGEGATARGGRLRTAAGSKRAVQTARIKGGGGRLRKPVEGGQMVATGGNTAKTMTAKPASAKAANSTKAPPAPRINGKEWSSLGRLRGAVPFDRGKGQTGYFVPTSSLTPAKRNKLGLGAFKSEVSGGNFTAQRHTQGSQEGWIISPRTPRGETPVQVQRSKSSKKAKTADDLLTQATRIELVGRRMSRAARTGARDRQIEQRALRAAKAARQRAFDIQKPPSKAEAKRRDQRLNSRTTAGLNARLARDYAARTRR